MNNIIPSLKYAWLTTKHKWFVFLAGLKTKASLWRLIVHDFSKFTPAELPHYGRQFFGDRRDPQGFIGAWIHHQNRNDHHWEYWIPRTGHNRCLVAYPDDFPVEMPEKAVREMVADWMGASRAYQGYWPTREKWIWFESNFDKLRLHYNTRKLCLSIIEDFYK